MLKKFIRSKLRVLTVLALCSSRVFSKRDAVSVSKSFHLSSVGPFKKTLQKAKELFRVSLLSLSKDSLVNFLGKTSRISASSFSSSSVICVKIFKHGPYFLPRKGYDSVSTSASFSFKQS